MGASTPLTERLGVARAAWAQGTVKVPVWVFGFRLAMSDHEQSLHVTNVVNILRP
jgi:hypothetical protein